MSKVIRTRTRRLLAVTGAFALAGSLLPGAALADGHEGAEAPGSRGVDRVCPAAEPASAVPSLSDIEDTTHEAAITCAVDYGFARGFTDGTYGPNRSITRGQAAAIATAMIEVAIDEDLDSPATSPFSDVPGTTHAASIDKLAEAGVIQGRTGGVFEPNDTITRGQMSRVIANAIDYADTFAVDDSLPVADDNEYFADVVGSPFQADIQALAGVGIVQGRTATSFEPAAQVTRGQMAAFVMRAADYLDREQRFFPTSVSILYNVTLAGENELSIDEATGAVATGVGELGVTAESTIVVDAFAGTLDFDLDFADVTGPFGGDAGFHIHFGDLGQNGGIAAFLATGAEVQAARDDDASVLTGTFLEADVADDVDFRLADLIEDPDLFYLNLHSEGFPAGAVRGQLPDGGRELLEAQTFTLTLTGENEVGADGFEDGDATATVTVDAVNRTITHVTDITDVGGTFAGAAGYHIHVGAVDENGPVVLFLATDTELQTASDADVALNMEIPDVDARLLRLILTNPENYYLNIHTTDFPAGAVRAQMG